jgi:hypothetical protein
VKPVTLSAEMRADIREVIKAFMVQFEARKDAFSNERYTREIYNAAAQYWKDGNKGGFRSRMNGTIKFGLPGAWEQGAASVEVVPADFSPEDKAALNAIITEEQSHVNDLLTFIDGLANNSSARLSDANPRLDMWIKRYNDVKNQALIRFGGKQRLQWKLGSAEHCETCLGLSNIIAWAQEWDKSGIKPKDKRLACHGYNCACELVPTDKRRTGRALEKIVNVVDTTGV